jgi:hypothetical protein
MALTPSIRSGGCAGKWRLFPVRRYTTAGRFHPAVSQVSRDINMTAYAKKFRRTKLAPEVFDAFSNLPLMG